MKKLFKDLKEIIDHILPVAFSLLCFGIVFQLILGEPILGWDVVGNISQAIGTLGQNTFVGVAALLFFYTMVVKDKKN
tara:strand:+ start:594 stop:827 length:234 start_codon:yes stop_codon:yes gene_type:complete